MKIVEEALLLNHLASALALTEEHDEVLIKRSEGQPVVMMSLAAYNELKAQIYRAKASGEGYED
ncbi:MULTISPECIES: hypothetical protein [Breznakia]|uniref:Antitoxin n=1 Tax=Breznakia blatticola TaxID=1754012 RepID=A0A4R7ZAQ6_9FIRM|nr:MULTISPECIES: hypothetical protein [Breznakia]MDH6367263.1 PHD/YefM family antitoxin component YafN of YafNO toxin-antitoxin module [Breznakia sp. PH1-1]MDH6404442.1 PHD/YefM family antitoxin component YafN of YafNO toxin-antitoxin module [Breznakia sp. PF1-11]MDH6412167.1 PHD/YefM family antitoxin component YafN of YafNO toxin-antitoxin module [Breznakia sp. PFB1-11]MDH6414430.1 PHD/YefM family antitoxin component YafN of YafNO toxin-antitoxin module [Breznakia sp. PFB1-14]MDH6416815.1 PHD